MGFAFSVDKNTVVQGGYTITYLGYGGAYGQGEGVSGGPNNMAGLLGGSYTVSATGGFTSAYGQWDNPATGAANPIPNVTPSPFSPSLGVAQTIYYLDYHKNGEAPMLQMWSASVQRQLPWHTILTVDYTANRVTHLSGYNRNPIEQPDPSVLAYGTLLTANINSAAAIKAGFTSPYPGFATQFGGSATVYQSLKPYPQYSGVSRTWDQSTTTFFHAFQFQADKHLSNNINFLANIELPRLFDNRDHDRQQVQPEAGLGSGLDRLLRIQARGSLRTSVRAGPALAQSGGNGQVDWGWQVSAILTYNNAQPLAITQTGEASSTAPTGLTSTPMSRSGRATTARSRCSSRVRSLRRCCSAPTHGPTPAASMCWATPTASITRFVAPGIRSENLSVKKLFHITEGTSFAVRMDYFNAFNRVQAPSRPPHSAPPTSARSRPSSPRPTARDRSKRPSTSKAGLQTQLTLSPTLLVFAIP